MEEKNKKAPVSCLRNERVIVRHVPKQTGIVTDPKHPLYGGMSERTVRTFVTPKLSNGKLVNVLTDSEKEFLEYVMGLDYNALSIYKSHNNFWTDPNNKGSNQVRLRKQDNYLDLSDPAQYIKYKILLANKDVIAPSRQALEDTPKPSYQFVIISEGEDVKADKVKMNTSMRCIKEYGKIENDIDVLRTIIEAVDGRPTAPTSSLEFLQTKAYDLIQANSKLFLNVITDPLLQTKVLIKKSIEAGNISNRGGMLYLMKDNTPLCDHNQEPTLNIAASWLNQPKHQEILFTLQALLKK